jgi:hypothetical protein
VIPTAISHHLFGADRVAAPRRHDTAPGPEMTGCAQAPATPSPGEPQPDRRSKNGARKLIASVDIGLGCCASAHLRPPHARAKGSGELAAKERRHGASGQECYLRGRSRPAPEPHRLAESKSRCSRHLCRIFVVRVIANGEVHPVHLIYLMIFITRT